MLACDIPVPADYVFVLRMHPKELEKRLKKRKYSQKKIRDNLESEALDYCSIRSRQFYPEKSVYDVDAGKAEGQILSIIKGKSKGLTFDFLDYFDSLS